MDIGRTSYVGGSSVNGQRELLNIGGLKSGASFMPPDSAPARRLIEPNKPVGTTTHNTISLPQIYNSRLAPSAITSEAAISARALLTPQYQHNILATRISRISNLYADAPRFRNQIDILA